MVSRLMLNLRREALRRKPILDYRSHTGAGGDGGEARFEMMTSTWALEPEVEYASSRKFEDSLIGNLGASVTSWGDDDNDGGATAPTTGDEEREAALEMSNMRTEIVVHVTEEIVVDDNTGPQPALPRRRPRATVTVL